MTAGFSLRTARRHLNRRERAWHWSALAEATTEKARLDRGVYQYPGSRNRLSNVIQAQSDRRDDCPHIRPNCDKPPLELRRRIKRLLKLDGSIGRNLRSKDAEEANFAFFSE